MGDAEDLSEFRRPAEGDIRSAYLDFVCDPVNATKPYELDLSGVVAQVTQQSFFCPDANEFLTRHRALHLDVGHSVFYFRNGIDPRAVLITEGVVLNEVT